MSTAYLVDNGKPSSQTLARDSSDALLVTLAPCIPSDASARVTRSAVAGYSLDMGRKMCPQCVSN